MLYLADSLEVTLVLSSLLTICLIIYLVIHSAHFPEQLAESWLQGISISSEEMKMEMPSGESRSLGPHTV